MKWRYRDVWVHYDEKLDGYGTVLARPFLAYLRRTGRPHYPRCFEWCAGPGFIGVTLLRAGLVGELVLADRNPAVASWVARTREQNDLPITYYESDNFKAIPEHEKFDLVVANPPNYFRLNPEHPSYLKMRDDPRPNDPGWKIHQSFYATVRAHLNPGAELFISEVEPHHHEVYLPTVSRSIAYDVRDSEPLGEFKKMILAGGLKLLAVEFYLASGGVKLYMMRSHFEGAPRESSQPTFKG